ncbi:MAG TPA: hypothetical protein VFG64_16090 [Dongiaceae bacterium]|nr:hypothetical protein [Dongiaceae bacterium]
MTHASLGRAAEFAAAGPKINSNPLNKGAGWRSWGPLLDRSVAVEGISPTLALAALVLGLAGHPRDAVENARGQAGIEPPVIFECAGMAIVIPGNGDAADTRAAAPPAIPSSFVAIPTRPNQTYSAALKGSVLAPGDPVAKTRPSGADTDTDLDAGALLDFAEQSPGGLHDESGCDSLLPKP